MRGVQTLQAMAGVTYSRRLILGCLAFFAVSWLLLGGWFDGEQEFRVWCVIALPIWSAHFLSSWRRSGQRAAVPVSLLALWLGLWWLTTCSYPGSNPSEECYLTRAQQLFWHHQALVSVIYGLFPVAATIEMLTRMRRLTPT